jgi:hypothetical protein
LRQCRSYYNKGGEEMQENFGQRAEGRGLRAEGRGRRAKGEKRVTKSVLMRFRGVDISSLHGVILGWDNASSGWWRNECHSVESLLI